MPYDLDYYTPLPPRRPESFGYGQQDMNALAQLMDPKQIWLSRFRQSPYGRPDPYGMNAMRDWLYPYLQSIGLAVGEQQR